MNNIKSDILLAKNWNDLEIDPHNNLQYRWSKETSSLYIKKSKLYEYLKIRVYNGTDIFNERILTILIDGEIYNTYNFFKNIEYLDIKLPISNKKEVTFHTENGWCPSKIDNKTLDSRILGFKIYSFLVDTTSNLDVLVPINSLSTENSEECFIDVTQYKYTISKLICNTLDSSIFYVGQYGTSGYASAAKAYIYKYFSEGRNIKWHPLKFDDSTLSKDCPYNVVAESTIYNEYDAYDMFIYHSTPDLWSTLNKQFSSINYGKKKIGYAVWETNRPPDSWIHAINSQVDELWCPSKYNFNVFEQSGVSIPISIIPHIFLPKKLIPKKDVVLGGLNGDTYTTKDGVYTFYSIGEFTERKGISDLLHAFCKAFTRNDKVRLLLKTHYKDYSPANKRHCLDKINEIVKQYPLAPEIHYIIDNLKENDILALHSLGDCYISLTKSEAFGITIFDAHNYEKPIIVTGFGGHMDYLIRNSTKKLIDYKLDFVKDMKDFSSNYSEDTQWAYPNLDHVIELMKGIIK